MTKLDLKFTLNQLGVSLDGFAREANIAVSTVYAWSECPGWVDGYLDGLRCRIECEGKLKEIKEILNDI